jgi:hypothetical protein
MAAAKVCIRANVPAEDPVAPAKAMGMNESQGHAQTLQG